MVRVSDIAKQAGTSTQSVYRALARLGSRLEGHVTQEKGFRLVDDEGARLIREALGTTTATITPPVIREAPQENPRLEALEKAILALVEVHQRESAAIRATVERQAEEIRTLRTAILPAPQAPDQPIQQVIPWSPLQVSDPAEGMPWWRVAWLSIVAPERLRRYAS